MWHHVAQIVSISQDGATFSSKWYIFLVDFSMRIQVRVCWRPIMLMVLVYHTWVVDNFWVAVDKCLGLQFSIIGAIFIFG